MQTCSETEKASWNFSAERTWSTHYADWTAPSSAHIKGRRRTSVCLRRGALPAGGGPGPGPDPEGATLLRTEGHLLVTSRLLDTLCPAIVRPPGGTPPCTIAHRHAITGRKPRRSQRDWGRWFLILFFDLLPTPPRRTPQSPVLDVHSMFRTS